jgi:hypothetical protein
MTQVNSTPGQNQVFANTAVAASQVSTQSNLGVGLIPFAGTAMITTVTAQLATPSGSPGVMGSGNLAVVSAPLTSYSPINTQSPGVSAVNAQISTQTNPSNNTNLSTTQVGGVGAGFNSITSAEQSTAIIGPVYYSPGGINNKVGPANSNLTTGGGP